MGAHLCPANQENLIQELKYDLAKPSSVANVQNGRQKSIQSNETRSNSQRHNDLGHCQNKKHLQNTQKDCNKQIFKIKEQIQLVTPISEELHKKYSQIQLPNKTIFKGITINNIPNGYGQQFHQNGDIFEGHFANGEKNGIGKYIFANNEQYEGEYSGNMMQGKGTYRFSNGDTYIGQFMNNCREGFGRYILKQPNQLKIDYFEGQYKQNERHGQGLVKYINGQTYKGLWKNDILVRTR